MPATKLSALTPATSATTDDELYVNDGGTSKKITFDNLQKSITAIGVLTTDVEIPADHYVYFGANNADGSWRIHISGGNLAFENRESGSWVEKGLVTT